jgi:hypothetical protein
MRVKIICCCLILFPPLSASAVDLWLYPEAADKNSFFAGVSSPAVSFTNGFAMLPPDITADYMTPFGLPFSFGLFMAAPNPNLKSFGLRAAYHIDFNNEFTDFFFLYVFDFGWIRNNLLIKYFDSPVDKRFFDFRAGVRRRFGKFTYINVETNYHLSGLSFGLALKLN